MNGPEFVLSLAAMGMISGLILSVIRTVGRALERKHSAGLLELEERVDFAERLLARERDRAQLPKAE